ncbi:MAG: Bifunctional primase/polymerase [Planctomycetaceae bacterium]|nr:Bifunctional primase/polymerase [Planctomycetaceae bacterium]
MNAIAEIQVSKAPPRTIEEEQSIIVAILRDPGMIAEVGDRLAPTDFSSHDFGLIFGRLRELHRAGKPLTIPHLTEAIRGEIDDETLGRELSECWEYAATFLNIKPFVADIIDKANQRTLLYAFSEVDRVIRHNQSTTSDVVARITNVLQSLKDVGPRKSRLNFRVIGETEEQTSQMRRYLIEGWLRIGETMNVIAASKFGKSWFVMMLALCVATGRPILGRYRTRQGKVLMIDNELHEGTFDDRLLRVAMAMGIERSEYAGKIVNLCLRGSLVDLPALSAELMLVEPESFDLIILDAFYRLLPKGCDENSNGDVAALYNTIDCVAMKINCSFICVHHSSKGNQAGKSITDVGAGAGSQSRAADTHLILRSHEAEGAVVVDAAVRSSPPVKPFVMRWEFPVWVLAEDLNPGDLKQEKPRRAPKGIDMDAPEDRRQAKDREDQERLMDAYRKYPEGETQSILRAACGLSGDRFKVVNGKFIQNGTVEPIETKKGRQNVVLYKLTEVGQVGQVGRNTTPSDLSGYTSVSQSDKSPPYRGDCPSDLNGLLDEKCNPENLSDLPPAPSWDDLQGVDFSDLEFLE